MQVQKGTMLTGEQEAPKPTDVGRFNVPHDKIEVNGEPYEHLVTTNNRADADTTKRVINELAEKHLGFKFPLAIRRYYQTRVFYDIYCHRWCVIIKGELVDTYKEKIDLTNSNPKWVKFKQECHEKVGAF